MARGKYERPGNGRGSVLYTLVGALLVLTLLSTWFTCGLFAKYVTSGSVVDDARVAGTGVEVFGIWEHNIEETYENSGVYKLGNKLVKGNKYNKVLPGVDLPKDPYIQLRLKDAEVDYYLYLKVTVKNVPVDSKGNETIKFELDPCWQKVPTKDGKDGVTIYQYGTPTIDKETGKVTDWKPYLFDAGQDFNQDDKKQLWILKDNLLYVSEHYVGGEGFTLTFDAWLKQVD